MDTGFGLWVVRNLTLDLILVWNQEYGILPLRLDSRFNCKVMEFGLEQTLTNPYVWFVYGL